MVGWEQKLFESEPKVIWTKTLMKGRKNNVKKIFFVKLVW